LERYYICHGFNVLIVFKVTKWTLICGANSGIPTRFVRVWWLVFVVGYV